MDKNIFFKKRDINTVSINKNAKLIFSLFLFSFFAVFFMRDVLLWPVPNVLFLIIFLVSVPFFNKTQLVASAITLPVFGLGFQANYAILFIMIVYFIKYYRKEMKLIQIIIILIFLVYELSHFFIPPFSIPEYIRTMLSYVLLAILIFSEHKDIRMDFVLKVFIISTLYLVAHLLLVTLIDLKFDFSQLIKPNIRFGNVKSIYQDDRLVLSMNENYLGLLCALSLQIVMLLYKKGRNLYHYILFAFIFTVIGLLTQSRAFIMMLLAIFGLNVVALIKDKKYQTALFLILMTILIGLFIIILNPNIINNVLSRFKEADISSGRIEIFHIYNKYILSNIDVLIFGIGLQSLESKMKFDSLFQAPHNIFQEAVLVWGIFGLVVLVFITYNVIKKYRHTHSSLVGYIPIILLFLYLQTGQILRAESSLLLFVLLGYCLYYESTTNEQKEFVLIGSKSYKPKELFKSQKKEET